MAFGVGHCSSGGRLLQLHFSGENWWEADTIERHNPLLIIDVFFFLYFWSSSEDASLRSRRNREEGEEKCVHTVSLTHREFV
jgi:hypothetical protein